MTTAKLNTGAEIPLVGLGTWLAEKGEVAKAIKLAVTEAGYRHIDCAATYGNEAEIGEAFKDLLESGTVKREELFITSKLFNTHHRREAVRQACEQTLKDLQIEYLDLYLIHWPISFASEPVYGAEVKIEHDLVPLSETWAAMEDLVKDGLVKAIGVSNFNFQLLTDLWSYAKIKPAVNQVELNVSWHQKPLVDHLASRGIDILFTGYSPLGNPGINKEASLFHNETVLAIAKKHNRTPAQVLIRFTVQRGLPVFPKSTNADRLKQNIDVFSWSLDEEDMKALYSVPQKRHTDPLFFWNIPAFN